MLKSAEAHEDIGANSPDWIQMEFLEFLSARIGPGAVKEPTVSQAVNAVLDLRSCQVSAS